MLWVKQPSSSDVSRAGLEQLLALDDAGVGLAEAFLAMQPLAYATWTAWYGAFKRGDAAQAMTLANDPSVAIEVTDAWQLDQGATIELCVQIARKDAFTIQFQVYGDGVGGFGRIHALAMHAHNIDQLVTFLRLVRLVGGELSAEGSAAC
jgi:hypothetical protein